MVQSGTPCWPSPPRQECQCSVLCSGTTGPAACGVLPAAGGVLPAAGPEDAEPPEQAPAPSRTAAPAASAVTALLTGRPPRRDIEMRPMVPIMPDATRCLA